MAESGNLTVDVLEELCLQYASMPPAPTLMAMSAKTYEWLKKNLKESEAQALFFGIEVRESRFIPPGKVVLMNQEKAIAIVDVGEDKDAP